MGATTAGRKASRLLLLKQSAFSQMLHMDCHCKDTSGHARFHITLTTDQKHIVDVTGSSCHERLTGTLELVLLVCMPETCIHRFAWRLARTPGLLLHFGAVILP